MPSASLFLLVMPVKWQRRASGASGVEASTSCRTPWQQGICKRPTDLLRQRQLCQGDGSWSARCSVGLLCLVARPSRCGADLTRPVGSVSLMFCRTPSGPGAWRKWVHGVRSSWLCPRRRRRHEVGGTSEVAERTWLLAVWAAGSGTAEGFRRCRWCGGGIQ